MSDTSRMSFAELKSKKVGIEEWMDKLAMELDDANKELAKRFGCFKSACFAPEPKTAAKRTVKRNDPKSGSL